MTEPRSISDRSGPAERVPRPPFRAATRVGLPLAIVLAASALLAWSLRGSFRPAIAVQVAVAVPSARGAAEPATTADDSGHGAAPDAGAIVQAPGWIEPSPYALVVPALLDGVVREVLVLEGERVETGAVVARLVDDDRRLEIAMAEAAVAEESARAAVARAELRAAEARRDEIGVEIERRAPLVDAGGVTAGELQQLRARHAAAASDVQVAQAQVTLADAVVARRSAELELARLRLSWTEVRSPAAGVVLTRLVEPGSRIGMGSAGMGTGAVLRLYDPARLQARVDVPLADAARVDTGTRAELVVEALPDRIFRGSVVRIVHEANIQRNTVQVKVLLEAPDAALKPEMLVRARLFVGGEPARGGSAAAAPPSGAGPVALPSGAVRRGEDAGAGEVWLVDRSGPAAVARRRVVRLGPPSGDGWIEILEGLRPGDRVVLVSERALEEGARVRIVGDAATGGGSDGAAPSAEDRS